MNVGTVREIWRYPVKSMGGEKLDACVVTPSGLVGDRGWALRDEVSGEIRGAKKWPALMQCHAAYLDGDGAVSKGTDTVFRSAEPPRKTVSVPHVSIRFPDGSTINSDDATVSERLSAFLNARVTLWPLQPASNKAHYRRKQPGASLVGLLCRSKTVLRALQAVLPYTPFDAQLRAELSREADEPVPNLAELPAELLEFATPPGTYFDAFPIHLLTTASLNALKRINPAAAWDARRFRPNFLIETSPEIEGLAESEWANRRIRIGGIELHCTVPTVRCGMTMHAQPDLPKDPSVLRTIVRDAAQNFGIYASVAVHGSVKVGDPVELVS